MEHQHSSDAVRCLVVRGKRHAADFMVVAATAAAAGDGVAAALVVAGGH